MTKVPFPERPVDQWCQQFKPSFLKQGLLDKFKDVNETACLEHDCIVDMFCKVCQKQVCYKCCDNFHRECHNCVTPDMKQSSNDNNSHIKLKSEIRGVSQQALDLIRRKEKTLLDELDHLTETQINQMSGEVRSGDIELKIVFEKQLDVDQIDRTLQLGFLKCIESLKFNLQLEFLSTGNMKTEDDKHEPCSRDIELLNIDGRETLVFIDTNNSSVKSCYRKRGKLQCSSLKLNKHPWTLSKIAQDVVAVSNSSNKKIKLIKLTPDPVRVPSIKTKKDYRCVTALSDRTLAAACADPPSIDVLDPSGNVLRSVITPSTGQQLIQRPYTMGTTRQGHIVVADSGFVYCVTQQGEVIYRHKVSGGYGGVTTTDTDYHLVADSYAHKIVQLTERGEYVRDLLTARDGIVQPRGIRAHGNKLYVSSGYRGTVEVFTL